MGFLLDTLESLLGLTDDEKAQLAPALPYLKQFVDIIDAHIDDLWALNEMFVARQANIKVLFDDIRVLGPNLSLLLGDGWVDIGATVSAVQDTQAVLKTFPTADAGALIMRLMTGWDSIEAIAPQISPALEILIKAYQRRGLTMDSVVAQLKGRSA